MALRYVDDGWNLCSKNCLVLGRGLQYYQLLLALQELARSRTFWPAVGLSGCFRHFSLALLTEFGSLGTVLYCIRYNWENRMRKQTGYRKGTGIVTTVIGFVVLGSIDAKLTVVSVFVHLCNCAVPVWVTTRRSSTALRLLRSWVRIPPGSWMFVCCASLSTCVIVLRLHICIIVLYLCYCVVLYQVFPSLCSICVIVPICVIVLYLCICVIVLYLCN
jgi:hypothetical protein